MTIGFVTSLRNTQLDAIKTALDAGGAAGKLRVYDGTRPATGGTATNLLAELTFSFPSASAAASGVLTFSAITADSSADAPGTATWCRIVTSASAFVADGSVSTSGADYNLNTTSITLGVQVSCTSAALTAGNA
jgi:hypothetical protein